MREISPAHNVTPSEFIELMPADFKRIVASIRQQKTAKIRPLPSASLIDKSKLLEHGFRASLLNKVAELVDENLFGRSEMCEQFASLLAMALKKLGLPAIAVVGDSSYFFNKIKIFSWRHAWVRVDSEVIDGNVDILYENPCVPQSVKVQPYWGPVLDVPCDRRLRQDHSARISHDSDVGSVWWPDLESWLGDYPSTR